MVRSVVVEHLAHPENEQYGGIPMKAYAIMYNEGVYYAGCRKADARTILGAQLFKSPKTALNVINKSINFPSRRGITLVEVELIVGRTIDPLSIK